MTSPSFRPTKPSASTVAFSLEEESRCPCNRSRELLGGIQTPEQRGETV